MFNNLMLDLETLDFTSQSVIVSVAAVKFNFHNDETENFCVNLDPHDGKRLGFTISQDTVDWWRKQNPEAVKAWKNGMSVQDGMTKFIEFISELDIKNTEVWANGIDFDLPILKNNLYAVGLKEPWGYWNQMDARTLYKLAKFNTRTAPREGNYHNALDDCHNQIKWLKQIQG